ncbi:MAG: 50S ribosomal protein L10 [Janthinobacterium lividum]
MDRNEKAQTVESLRSALKSAELVVLARQSGLTVDESLDLRRKVRAAKAHFKVTKNTLVRLAIKDTVCESLSTHLTGPTALAFSEDPIAAAKVIAEFAKKNEKLEIVCGVMNGSFLDASRIKELATLPSLDELRGKIVGLLQAPGTKIAGVLQAPAGQLARLFAAYADKQD